MAEASKAQWGTDELIGASSSMQKLREELPRLAGCDVQVLLEGESGTGKEVVARAIHRMSGRRTGPFIGVNCAAINQSLLESELFGHEAGAFTGARHATLGFLRAANRGTILLDEIGDMAEPLQSALLRVLEERVVVPVGATQPVPVDIRVLAATHVDLAQAVTDGRFREDLFYRVNVVRVLIPPLRQRLEDIPLLTQHALQRVAELLGVPPRTVSGEVMRVFMNYRWPGNIRQLQNVIQRAYVLGRGDTIEMGDLPKELFETRHDGNGEFLPLSDAICEHLKHALNVANGNRSQAARFLGIDRKSLWRMMRRHGIA